jgi:hypothetical protein
MEHMQDKAFDQLFKDHFEGAELQPSATVWDNIKKELRPERKRKSPVYWMAAATVVLTLSVSLLLTRTEKIKLQGKAELVNESHPAAGTRTLPMVDESPSSSISSQAAKPRAEAPVMVVKADRLATRENNLIAMQPKPVQLHLRAVEAQLKPVERKPLQENEKPEVENSLVTEQRTEIAAVGAFSQNGAMLGEEAATMPRNVDQPVQDADQHVVDSRTRIRNAGDLVNFVVDKIDKREQKIVEFNTDDDDNSSLIAVNIGPFRFNSKKHK